MLCILFIFQNVYEYNIKNSYKYLKENEERLFNILTYQETPQFYACAIYSNILQILSDYIELVY